MDMGIMKVILCYLTVLSVYDFKERQVPLKWLAAGAVLLLGMGGWKCLQGDCLWMELLIGLLPGGFLLLLARITGKVGYADGIVLTELGICLGYQKCVLLFCLSLLLISMVSMILLFLHRVNRNTHMPYLPFLSAAFLLQSVLFT